jgi:hypothetical protein
MMGRPQARYLICSGPSNGTRLSSSGNRAMFVAIRRASSAVNGLCGCGFVLDPLSRRRACSQMKDRTQEYRRLAAECLRLAGTTDDANSHAQYTALAQMWIALAEEAEERRAVLNQAQDAFNEAQFVQQQQAQPKKTEADKS